MFSPEARAELLEARAYFHRQKRGRAVAFTQEVRRVSTLLCEFPALGASHGPWRVTYLRGFAHALLYQIKGDVIYVNSLLHQESERYSRLVEPDD